MEKEIDADYQAEITCPYCGWKDQNSWESDLGSDDDDEVECGECGKQFDVHCTVTRDFSSTKKKDAP